MASIQSRPSYQNSFHLCFLPRKEKGGGLLEIPGSLGPIEHSEAWGSDGPGSAAFCLWAWGRASMNLAVLFCKLGRGARPFSGLSQGGNKMVLTESLGHSLACGGASERQL